MLRTWLRAWQRWREDAAVARRPIPDDLWKRTLVRYPFLRRRDDPQALRLRRLTALFLDRKEFQAVGGLKLTDAMVVAIAAQACLPILEMGLSAYASFVGILVHPDQVLAKREYTDEDGLVHTYDEPLAGETMAGGPVTLSWRDVRAAGKDPITGARLPYAVVIHEFVHVLDLAQGPTEGLPLGLPADLSPREWLESLQAAWTRLCAAVEAEAETLIDPYGAESLTEFFAVAAEAFFVTPQALRADDPGLYALLSRYFRQDPAEQAVPARS